MSQTKREQTVFIFSESGWLIQIDLVDFTIRSLWKVPKTCSYNCELNMMFCGIDHKESVKIQNFAIKQKDDQPLKATQALTGLEWPIGFEWPWVALSGLERPIALSGLEWPWVADCFEWPWVADCFEWPWMAGWLWVALSGRLALSGLDWPILPFATSTRIANPL